MFCQHCSEKISDDNKFCQHCGEKIVIFESSSSPKKSSQDLTASPKEKSWLGASWKPLLIVIATLSFVFWGIFFGGPGNNTDLHSFTIGFPSKSEFKKNSMTYEGINTTAYTAAESIGDGGITYNVIISEFPEKLLNQESIDGYLSVFPENLFQTATKAKKHYSNKTKFLGKYEAVEYKYQDEISGVTVLHRGVHFVINGDGMQLSILYTNGLENVVGERYSKFINSFSI